MPIESFTPPKRTLMGPGPTDMHPNIYQALSKPIIGHLDPEFVGLMDQIKQLLRDTFLTQNQLTFPVSAPGSAGMETCFSNLVEEGEKVLICVNGVFGKRMEQNVLRQKGIPVLIEGEWGRAIDPTQVQNTIKKHPDATTLAFVHAETSTGALSNGEQLGKIAREANLLCIVDCVTSLGGVELRTDDWGWDAVYSGTQKCLSCVPGLSPVTFSQRAIEKIEKRKSPCTSWFLDLKLVMDYWKEGAKRSYHHTAPINSLYALHEALVLVQNEGLEDCWKRHQANHEYLRDQLLDLGLEFIVPTEERLPQLNAVKIPNQVDDAKIRKQLLDEYNIEIGGGLGPLAGKIWRIGLMGYGSNKQSIDQLVNALKQML